MFLFQSPAYAPSTSIWLVCFHLAGSLWQPKLATESLNHISNVFWFPECFTAEGVQAVTHVSPVRILPPLKCILWLMRPSTLFLPPLTGPLPIQVPLLTADRPKIIKKHTVSPVHMPRATSSAYNKYWMFEWRLAQNFQCTTDPCRC